MNTSITKKMTKPSEWLLCPHCHSKTRVKVRQDTKLTMFPLFCPKCKVETLVSVENLYVKIESEPDAMTQSQ